eukprot:gene21986-biopygen11706
MRAALWCVRWRYVQLGNAHCAAVRSAAMRSVRLSAAIRTVLRYDRGRLRFALRCRLCARRRYVQLARQCVLRCDVLGGGACSLAKREAR